jgi:tetratricopeptide (TPR) repeat protein
VEQALRHSAQKQTVQAMEAYRRAAGVLQEAIDSRQTDHWNPLQVSELWLQIGVAQHGLGERAAALASVRRAASVLQEALHVRETDPGHHPLVVSLWLRIASSQNAIGQAAAALASVRRAATISTRLAQQAPRDLGQRRDLAYVCQWASTLLRQQGAHAEARDQAECAKQLYEGLVRDAPGELRHKVELSDTWNVLGKARWKLEQYDGALAAFRAAVQLQRDAFESSPGASSSRQKLSLRYSRLAYWLRLRGCLAEAAANLLEQKKLWPGNAKMLLEISGDLAGLAAAVGGGRRELTPTEQVERQRYLDLSEQVAREAGAPQPKAGGAQP